MEIVLEMFRALPIVLARVGQAPVGGGGKLSGYYLYQLQGELKGWGPDVNCVC